MANDVLLAPKCSIAVSAKFVFGTDIKVVAECSEEYQDFVREMSNFFEMLTRVMVELPLYKLYNNKREEEKKE